MTLNITISLFLCLLGLALYLFSGNNRVAEAARITFWTGLAFTLLALGGRAIHVS